MYSEATLRKRAYKIGYKICKGFVHFGREVYHDEYGRHFTGFMILDQRYGNPLPGCIKGDYDFQLSLEDIEDFLETKYEELGLKW